MNLVVDTNIVFSALLNPKSSVGELLMDIEDNFNFFAPNLLSEELERYEKKIRQYSKLSGAELENIKSLILSNITFVSEELISEDNWKEAYEIAKDIDEDDTPFVALSLELKAKLWTGDKVLTKGLNKKHVDLIISTKELQNFSLKFDKGDEKSDKLSSLREKIQTPISEATIDAH